MLNGAGGPGRLPTMDTLVLVRHGESVGNVADARARSAGAGRLDLDTRDPDTPLSERGERQATVLAQHVATAEARRPDVVLRLAVPAGGEHGTRRRGGGRAGARLGRAAA